MAMPSLTKSRRRGMQRQSDMLHPLEREMNRLFDDFGLSPFGRGGRWEETPFLPAIDVHENENEIRVSAELPGLDDKDIDVTVQKDTVRISGEKRHESESNDQGFYRREASYGAFDRVVDLPTDVDEQKAEAAFKNGVLTITMPKDEDAKAKTRKVPIKTT